ncbi:MAG: helix-turn-helix domain-containing protein, partial [Bacteroidota bacterium]|nr:helix-turn-helix domain-containing protein [Bacteroidota bacterium]
METLLWIGLSQSFFAGLIIVTKKNKSTSDQILSAWLFLLAIFFLLCGIDSEIYQYPLLTNSFLLINPAFYLYIKSLIQQDFKLKWKHYFHLSPFVLIQLIIYVQETPFSLNSIMDIENNAVFGILFIFVSLASWFFYNIISIKRVNNYHKNLKNELSNIEHNISLRWVLFILIFYILFCIAVLLLGAYFLIVSKQLIILYHITNSILLVMVYILGFYGLRQTKININTNQENDIKKYKNSLLTVKNKEEIKESIINYFKSEKPYFDSEFNMDKLSLALNIPKHNLTEVLSTELGNNFFSFVNNYRINSVKEKLNSNDFNLFSIESIGYDCGFSSKSSFFTSFKKVTGKTP